jgi:hypothetical protein
MKSDIDKIAWSGRLLAVQPRIRLLRSYNELQHQYLGYVLTLKGKMGGRFGEYLVAVGHGAHIKHQFHAGMEICGVSRPVENSKSETSGWYQTSQIIILDIPETNPVSGPPFLGIPPDLEVYRERGHRRLSPVTYASKCKTCYWSCRMPVEIIVDHWNPSVKQCRFETFCYGPLSCRFYKAGATRKVPGRKGMIWEEEDWIDEEATSHREPDE